MKSFSTLISYTMVMYIGIGIGTAFTIYFMTYYFELTTEEMAVLPLGTALASIFAFIITPILSKRFDKKSIAFWSTIIFAFFFSLPFNARLLGLMPENGEPVLLLYYFLSVTVAYTFIWIALILASSMMADVIDENEVQVGTRQEGLFFSSMSFAYKCTAGLGTFIAGLLLDFIAFPKQVAVGQVPQEAIDGLGWIGGPVLMLCYMSSIIFIYFYPITRDRYQAIRSTLDNR